MSRVFVRAALVATLLVAITLPVAAQADPIARATALLEEARYADARALLEPLAAGRSPSPDAAVLMARAALAMRDVDAAADVLERAVRHAPGRADVHLWLGRAYAQQAMSANPVRQASLARRMRRAWERSLELDPQQVEARADLVQFYLIAPGIMGGSRDRALEEVAAIERLNPYRGILARVFIHERDADTVALTGLLARGIEAYPDSLALHYRLGFLHQGARRWDAAFDTFEGILARDGTEMMARYQVGRTGALSGERLELAESRLREYLAGEPGNGDPSHAWAHVRIGNIHEHAGRTDAARAAFRTALELDPTLNAAREALARLP